MNNVSKLLWIDCSAGAFVGLFVLIFHNWLSALYVLPINFVLFQGFANLAYSYFSFSLAAKRQRVYSHFVFLALANISWGMLCMFWYILYSESASIFGLTHLFLEAIFVGGLGYVELSYRRFLLDC